MKPILPTVAAVFSVVALVLLQGCGPRQEAGAHRSASGEVDVARPYNPKAGLTPDQRTMVTGYNDFGFRLLRRLTDQEPGQNVLISPLSIATALAMLLGGAAGTTQQQMARALGLTPLSAAAVGTASDTLRRHMQSVDPRVELDIANSLWARRGVPFKPAFLQAGQQSFGAEISSLDFSGPQAANTINGWVEKNTKGKIKQIIEPKIDPMAVMFLINAIYFKGVWQITFDKSKTHDQTFALASGDFRQMPFMHQTGSYQHSTGDGFQAINLPYGSGRISLYLFLPDQGVSPAKLLQSLNEKTWVKTLAAFKATLGDVALPRFKLEYLATLNETLQALGIRDAFDARLANFSGMNGRRDLWLSEVKHKAAVEMNEKGTEAAAATVGVVSAAKSGATPEKFTFVADHPFLGVIRDNQTGSILFLGVVMEPK